ncbi:MAG: hypothetical protein LBR15_03575 [Methanobrevibacter sp.]|jgi:hypothetical protein|nr:hypothetical protein [Candidatus Methanovirga australis]
MSDSDYLFSPALYYAILTALIVFTVTQIFAPVIMCFLDKFKRCFCPCFYEDEEVADPNQLTPNDVIKPNDIPKINDMELKPIEIP